MEVKEGSIPEEDKTFFIAVMLTIGVFGCILGGGFGAYLNNTTLMEWAKYGIALLLGPAGIYWGLYQKNK